MYLYLLRHGEADWPDWKKPDDERPLTEHGRKEMKKIADFLRALDIELDQIVTSPLPRAKETAQIVADKLNVKLREEPVLKPGFDPSGLAEIFQKYPGDSIMIVGHEPDFSRSISALTGGSVKLSKAGLALIDLESKKSGRLLWLFPPRVVKAAAR